MESIRGQRRDRRIQGSLRKTEEISVGGQINEEDELKRPVVLTLNLSFVSHYGGDFKAGHWMARVRKNLGWVSDWSFVFFNDDLWMVF